MFDPKALRNKRLQIANDWKAVIDGLKEGEYLDADGQAKIDAMRVEIQGIDNLLKAADDNAALMRDMDELRMSNARGAPNGGEGADPAAAALSAREAKAFRNWIRGGSESLTAEDSAVMARRATTFTNAQGVTTGAAGGFTVPEGFYGKMVDAQLAYGGMLASGAEIIDSDSGNPLPVPMDNDTMNVGYIVGENTQVPDGANVLFQQMVLGAYEYTSGIQKASRQFLQDSAFNMDAWLPKMMGIRIARRLNLDFTLGTGVGQPFGVVTRAVMAGNGYTCPTGETVSITWPDLLALMHKVDPAYRDNARFMFHDNTLFEIQQIKDTQNRPLWVPAIAGGSPDMIFGKPYTINQQMPVPAANAVTILFGDFSAYKIRRVAGASMARLVERYADLNQVGFVGFQRWDGNLADAGTHPIAYLQQSAT